MSSARKRSSSRTAARAPGRSPAARGARPAKTATAAKTGKTTKSLKAPRAPRSESPAASASSGAAAVVAVGEPVADFTLPGTGGAPWRLSDARGSKLVLYFYPRDNTPGCTQEGVDFAALAARFAATGTRIVGISRDSLASHEKFRDKMGFPFPLLADVDERVCRQFDVIRMKTLYGRSSLGLERSTFLLDASGVLRREWRKVRVAGHAAAVLEAASAL